MLTWQPAASIQNLRQRATVIRALREFFYQRGVLEVETPALAKATIPDPNIQSMTAKFTPLGSKQAELCYLQTSPEFFMKRLLAAGYGSIFQLSKVFRDGEVGRLYNPEFTLLEWYRVEFDFKQLIQEVDELLQIVLNTKPAEQKSYQAIFLEQLQLDPLQCSVIELKQCAAQRGITIQGELERDEWLNLLFSHLIEPMIGLDKPMFVYHYPATQAALARLNSRDLRVAERFECFYRGYELANGFGELADAAEQRARFDRELRQRQQKGLALVPIDENFLAALTQGFPHCAGVAMGVDRLIMLAIGASTIQEVLAFDFSRC